MEKKDQHVIPECYLKAWCDPASPVGYVPYVWVASRDGKEVRNKAPRKIFTSSDFYTIKLNDGSRNLVIEDTFSAIEGRFTRLRDSKLCKDAGLNAEDLMLLCVFSAMLCARVHSERAALTNFFTELHDHAVALEEFHLGKQAEGSATTDAYRKQGHQLVIGHQIDSLMKWFLIMKFVILTAPANSHFITSDNPCVRFNPQWPKMPPMLRGGLTEQDIEVTVPLSPRHLAHFSWIEVWKLFGFSEERFASVGPYLPVPEVVVDEINGRTRFYCDEFFVTQTRDLRAAWFAESTA